MVDLDVYPCFADLAALGEEPVVDEFGAPGTGHDRRQVGDAEEIRAKVILKEKSNGSPG